MPLLQNGKLLPQGQVLQEQIATRAKGPDQRYEQKPQQAQHGASLTRKAGKTGYTSILLIQRQIVIVARHRIASSLGDRLWFLDLDRVSHFYAEDKLTYAVSEGRAYFIDHAIAELERKLDPSQFTRIHRSTVVNLAWVKEVTSLPGGALNIRLKDGKST